MYSESTADGYEVYVATHDDQNVSINEDVYYYDSDLTDVIMEQLEDRYSVYIDEYLYDEIYMDGRRIDVRQVKANVLKLLADNPQGTVVVQADKTASADAIIQVMDGARDAGVFDISLAAEPN